MKISNLIDRDFATVSVLEDLRDVSLWLDEKEYLAIADEDSAITGIMTREDLRCNKENRNVIDCNIDKPKVDLNESIPNVHRLMKEAGTDFLPVYERGAFVGVIGLINIMDGLLESVAGTRQIYQQVIHDLRNPLANIHGLLALLQEKVIEEENLDLLRLCNSSARHALDILDDLLYTEIDENIPLNKQPTEIGAFYKECIREQEGINKLKKVIIATDFCTDKIVKNIDRNRLKRAVQNVIVNAVKFSFPESVVKIFCHIEGEVITLKIKDEGMGIPEALKAHIFKKFTAAQRPGTCGEPSTGLGLYFSRQCLEHHKGHIYFESKEGKGTSFFIVL